MGSSHDDFIKYPRTPHLFGSRGTDDDKHLGKVESERFVADDSLVIEEKIDGTNVGIHFHSDGKMILQCRGHLITEGMHPQYDLFKQWTVVKRSAFEERLEDRYILFGEWMYARHSLHYRQLPHYFFEFDIYDKKAKAFLSLDLRTALLEGTNIQTVPVLHRGAVTREQLEKLVGSSRFDIELRRTAERLAAQESPGQSTYSSDIGQILARFENRNLAMHQFVDAYRQYCWPVQTLDDLRLAPFHLLATEGKLHTDQDHVWHMQTLARICCHDPALLLATPFKVVDLSDPESETQGIDWWLELTGRGGEGMVVKPWQFVTKGSRGLVQPAVKCRGREYLRIIYGPEYTFPENLSRLRQRGLATKRSLALREFALGVEGLERFVDREPLRRVHECVFGVLALESEPVDPRL